MRNGTSVDTCFLLKMPPVISNIVARTFNYSRKSFTERTKIHNILIMATKLALTILTPPPPLACNASHLVFPLSAYQ